MSELVREGSIGAVLCSSGIITEEELQAALKEQQASGCRIGEALVQLGIVDQEDIDWALSNQLDLPWVRLKKDDLDPAALARVPAELARRYRVIPVVLSGDELSVALEDPLDQEARAALARETGCRINVAVALRREIREMLDLCYGVADLGFGSRVFGPDALSAINADPSAARLLDELLNLALQREVTQLGLAPAGERVLVTARSAGCTVEIGILGLSGYAALLARVRNRAGLEHSAPVAARGTLVFSRQEREVTFQVLLLREQILSIKPYSIQPRFNSLADLTLAPEIERELRILAAVPEGLLLVGGRDPGARNAFLDLFLDQADTEGKSVLVVGEGIGAGTRRFPQVAALREGVDETRQVIQASGEHEIDLLAVEDLADPAAVVAAGSAALRGSAVVAGISAAGMMPLLERLYELRREQHLVPGVLKGALFVAAPFTLCRYCREEYPPAADEIALLRLASPPERLFRRRGCTACGQSGYRGRQYLVELVLFQGSTGELFRQAHSATDLLARLKEKGYRGVAEQGRALLVEGEISAAEFLAAVGGGN
ncbi:ATPase, T2SS/T4P/T4SS family [Geomesophilobacter sediminis]|uniref:Pilus assembly protein PilB n=1 Tax=Geomesophilobacter sediminis TaxID=2798584 RepID=A0A8J7LV95_9BACT|nr:pilus assembly protein PilB [Geomesophilobacter sediminis]MBJ6724705.1 pilus assembly protein PilB [Geomesophilobacter sediminis]